MFRKNKHLFLVLTFSSLVAVLFVGGWLLLLGLLSPASGEKGDESATAFSVQLPLEVILQRQYVCGEMLEERIVSHSSAEAVRKRYAGWDVAEQTAHRLVLTKTVDDLAPQCKAHGFFGITDEGLMTLFYGPPEDGNVIRTFYQLDVERLETSLPKQVAQQLRDGIRVSTVQEFHSVLSTYAEFIQESG
jgi:forespore regulator of the sigma-K checkpoint